MAIFNKKKLKNINTESSFEKKYTILLVDDEISNLKSLEQTLGSEYNILTANNGIEAIELIKNYSEPEQIKLIITDQRMPQKTGIEFLKETIDIIPKTIKIILTAFSDIEAIISAINEGRIYKYLSKPIEPKYLKLVVKRSLETLELKEKNNKLITELEILNSSLERNVEERTIEILNKNQLQKRLVESIVHDLKNPLSNILMFSKYINNKYESKERIKKTAELIHSSARNMAKMVESILEIDKIEKGSFEPNLTITDLVKVFSASVILNNEYAKSKNINLKFKNRLERAVVLTDSDFIKRISNNFLSNAIKFSPFDKDIEIFFFKNEVSYVFEVKDNGPGFTEEDKKKGFKKFSVLSAKPTDGEHSTGLGLSISKNLAEIINCNICFDSQLGKGSTFYLTIPFD